MPAPRTPVVSTLQLRLVSGSELVPLAAELVYDPADPYAVRVRFSKQSDQVTVEWVLSRQLLRDGLVQPVGEGDVGVWPSTAEGSSVVCLALSSPGGQALLVTESDDLSGFLDRTENVVASGREGDYLDLDALVDDLLTAPE